MAGPDGDRTFALSGDICPRLRLRFFFAAQELTCNVSTQLHDASRRVHWSRASASRLDWASFSETGTVGAQSVLNTCIPTRLYILYSSRTGVHFSSVYHIGRFKRGGQRGHMPPTWPQPQQIYERPSGSSRMQENLLAAGAPPRTVGPCWGA